MTSPGNNPSWTPGRDPRWIRNRALMYQAAPTGTYMKQVSTVGNVETWQWNFGQSSLLPMGNEGVSKDLNEQTREKRGQQEGTPGNQNIPGVVIEATGKKPNGVL